MSLLDSMFGIQTLYVNAVALITRKKLNFVVASNQVAYADNGTTTQLSLGFPVAAAAPTTGAHVVGEVVLNSVPVSAGTIGWVCTTAGTPGTWKTWGVIS